MVWCFAGRYERHLRLRVKLADLHIQAFSQFQRLVEIDGVAIVFHLVLKVGLLNGTVELAPFVFQRFDLVTHFSDVEPGTGAILSLFIAIEK